MSHGRGGGVRKCVKSVMFYLNGPLQNTVVATSSILGFVRRQGHFRVGGLVKVFVYANVKVQTVSGTR